MVRILSYGIEGLSTLVFLIPAIMLLQGIVFREYRFSKLIRNLLFASYIAAVFTVTGIPTIYTLRADPQFHLIPLIDMFQSPWDYLRNTLLNILLFVPMGFLAFLNWEEYRSLKSVLRMGLAVSVMIELLQLFTFRLTDLDDVITNTLGACIGYRIAQSFARRWPQSLSAADGKTSARHEPIILLTAALAVFSCLKPLASDALWDIVLESPLWKQFR